MRRGEALRKWVGRLKQRAHLVLGRQSMPRGSVPPLRETPNVASDRFLFIGGLHRSGTSIVHRLLREHPQMSGFHDTGVPEDEGQFLQSVFPPARAFGGPGRFAFDPASRLDDLAENWTPAMTETLLREWGSYYDLQKRVLLEKSPPNLVRHRFLSHVFPEARFLFILRHPVCVALATRKWAKSSPVELLLHWSAAHQALVRSHPGRRILILRYEDFVADSARAIEEIHAFAGVEPHRPTEAVEDRNQVYLSEWERRHRPDADLVTAAFPDLIRCFARAGYSLEPPFVHRFDRRRFPSSAS